MDVPKLPPYMLIIGSGRSGTNWLLSILDASPFTHARNEPYGCKNSPFKRLPSRWDITGTDAAYEKNWDTVANWTAAHVGEMDLRVRAPKRHVHEYARKLGIANWSRRPKLRKALSIVSPRFGKGEWTMPAWIGDPGRLEQACAVFKLNRVPGIACWVLKNRPDVPVLHIVRHPGGRTDSWRRRLLSAKDPDQTRALNIRILAGIAASEPDWAGRFGVIDELSLTASENWMWCYQTEMTHIAGAGKPQYKLITYESLAMDTLGVGRDIYEFAGLPWSATVESTIAAGLGNTPWGKLDESAAAAMNNWRQRLDSVEINEIEQILAGSLMADWWSAMQPSASAGHQTREA